MHKHLNLYNIMSSDIHHLQLGTKIIFPYPYLLMKKHLSIKARINHTLSLLTYLS